MNNRMLILAFIIPAVISYAQTRRNIEGTVLDAKTKEPLSCATIKLKEQKIESVSNQHGTFGIQTNEDKNDSLEVSHLGYKTVRICLRDINGPINVLLEDYSVELRPITITSKKVNMKEIDQHLRPIRGNLYAYDVETTNGQYGLFLDFLIDEKQNELLNRCNYDLSPYDETTKEFYQQYTAAFQQPSNKNDTTVKDYTTFPVVNISHEAATLFCQWFTEQYNTNPGKKKFKKVRFRLPTQKEWQVAALGYPGFQSWNLDENTVPVVVPADTLLEIRKGSKKEITVRDIKYPWWNHYNYRKKVLNAKNCYLGNFKSPPVQNPCPIGRALPGNDGWTKMARTANYFPNDMGLYDVVGNVAEMIAEPGKAFGGSWNDAPENSTIRSVKLYKRPDDTIGFRMFMEVIEE